jgi:aspartyl/asparaginyl beta-hydroxylase (cupin superfamily)
MFPISSELDEAIDRCVNESVRMLCTPVGVVLRAMITALPPGKAVSRHRDDGLCARFAHRIHVPLVGNEGVVYKIGSYRLRLSTGVAYDFNNRWLHAVENASDFWRVNLILDYLEDGAVPNPWLRYGWRP